MNTQVKRSMYTPEFKIKVLEHYLKNGGENVFGLKAKTALHFNIGKKTVHRIVENKHALLAAKARKAKKAIPSEVKAALNASSSKASISKIKVSSLTSSSGSKPSTKSSASKTFVSKACKTSTSKTITSSSAKAQHVGAIPGVSSKKKDSIRTATPPVEQLTTPQDFQEEVLELPEDPDFSVLKRPISGGVTGPGAAGPALLLSTATREVQNALMNECDIIYECKICKNLFRSIVNFLAHKRIFCTTLYNTEKTLYSQGMLSQFTPHSSTVFSTAGVEHSARHTDGSLSSGQEQCSTSQQYARLQDMERNMQEMSKDCSVVLEDIRDVPGVKYQSVAHPDGNTDAPEASVKEAREMVASHEQGVTAVLNEEGKVVNVVPITENLASLQPPADDPEDELALDIEQTAAKQLSDTADESFVCPECDREFSGRKSLRTHLKNVHSTERTVFSCPLTGCTNTFLSLWATGKHLIRAHKKTRQQVDNLRNTIKKNSFKKTNVKSPVKTSSSASEYAASSPAAAAAAEEDPKSSAGEEGAEQEEDVEEDEEEENEEEEEDNEIVIKQEYEVDESALQRMDMDEQPPTQPSSLNGVQDCTDKDGEYLQQGDEMSSSSLAQAFPMAGLSPSVLQPQRPRCPHCSMFFVTERSLATHLQHYCHKVNQCDGPPIPPQHPMASPFLDTQASPSFDAKFITPGSPDHRKDASTAYPHLPLRKLSPPTKKIGIQIRKVYKTEEGGLVSDTGSVEQSYDRRQSGESEEVIPMIPLKIKVVPLSSQMSAAYQLPSSTPSSAVVSTSVKLSKPLVCAEPFNSNNNTVDIKTVKYPNSQGPLELSKIEEIMKTFCDLTKYACKLCRKKFYSYTNIRRHAAIHMNWTRYACLVCGFRTYHKFQLLKHLHDEHQIQERDSREYFEDVFYLNDTFKTSVTGANQDTSSSFLSDSLVKQEPPDELDTSVNPLEMVDVIVEEITYPDETSMDETKEHEEDDKEEQKSASASNSPEVKVNHKPIATKTVTLRLKKVNLDTLPDFKVKGSLLEEKIKSLTLAKSHSFHSDIATVTVSAKPIVSTPSPIKPSTPSPKTTPVSSPIKTITLPSPVASSRQRRIIKPPVKRRFPNSPPTFTAVSKKCRLDLGSSSSLSSNRTPSKKMKINITSLTKKV